MQNGTTEKESNRCQPVQSANTLDLQTRHLQTGISGGFISPAFCGQPAVNAALQGLTGEELSWHQHNAAPTLQNGTSAEEISIGFNSGFWV